MRLDMKIILAFFLALCASFAGAQTASPVEVAAQCRQVMLANRCGATPPSARPLGWSSMQAFTPGLGKIDWDAFLYYEDQYTSPTDFRMCDSALVKMTTEPGSKYDITARVLWTPIKPQEQVSEATAWERALAGLRQSGPPVLAFAGLALLLAARGRRGHAASLSV